MNDQPIAETAKADLAAIMRLVPDGPYAHLITNATSRRHALYEHLANSADPLWKEIGTQLRDGQLRPRDLLGIEAYRTHLIDTMNERRHDFPAALAKTREHLESEDNTRH